MVADSQQVVALASWKGWSDWESRPAGHGLSGVGIDSQIRLSMSQPATTPV